MTTDPSPLEARLREIREREQKATKGPWQARLDDQSREVSVNASYHFPDEAEPDEASVVFALPPGRPAVLAGSQIASNCWDLPEYWENMQFIAHARADVPWLISQLEAWQKWSLALVLGPGASALATDAQLRSLVDREVAELRDDAKRNNATGDTILAAHPDFADGHSLNALVKDRGPVRIRWAAYPQRWLDENDMPVAASDVIAIIR